MQRSIRSRTLARTLVAGALTLALAIGTLVASTGVALAAPSSASFGNVACHGGILASGSYQSLTIWGACATPSKGAVVVHGKLEIEQNAFLDAHVGRLIVFGNVFVEHRAGFILGCEESGCSSTNDRIFGNVDGDQPLALIFHHNVIHGSIWENNGGGGKTCATGAFSDFEDNTISGDLKVTGLRTCWFGMFRDVVRGNVLVMNDITLSTDGNEIATNTIFGNLACFHNFPHAQIGDSGGAPNTVSGAKLGECASL